MNRYLYYCSSCTRSDDVRDPVQHGSSELPSSQVWRPGDGFAVRGGQHGDNDPHGHACPGETRTGHGVRPLPALARSTLSAPRYRLFLTAVSLLSLQQSCLYKTSQTAINITVLTFFTFMPILIPDYALGVQVSFHFTTSWFWSENNGQVAFTFCHSESS